MVGVSLIALHESLDELSQQLQQAKTPRDKERLQVLYWLKQNNPPLISTVANRWANTATLSKPGCRSIEPGEWQRC